MHFYGRKAKQNLRVERLEERHAPTRLSAAAVIRTELPRYEPLRLEVAKPRPAAEWSSPQWFSNADKQRLAEAVSGESEWQRPAKSEAFAAKRAASYLESIAAFG